MRIRILSLFIIISNLAFAQQHDHHFSEDDIMVKEVFKKRFPELADKVDAEEAKLEAFTQQYIKNHKYGASRSGTKYIIPVVFHILHQNGPENVTNTEIHDAVRILNEDFQKMNADTIIVVSAFKNLVGDADIEFRLARLDPNGKPTNGIDRIETSLTNNAGEGSKLNPWPRSTYLNIWIVKTIGSGAAGYTFLPSTAHWRPNQDGIILLYTYFSSVRTGSDRRSRALTHEIGHWLNLPHPWGGSNTPGRSTNCSIDDGVWDTPNTIGWTSCSLNGNSCGSLDNVQNYMEYSYCSNMFTLGQVQRMHAALNSSTAQRRDLVSEVNNRKAGVLDLELADFSVNQQFACVGEALSFEDKSIYDAVAWKWEFEGGNPSISNAKNPKVTYYTPGTYKVKLTVTAANGSKKTKESEEYIVVNRSVGSFLPFEESFESHTEEITSNWIAQNEDNDDIFWKIGSGVGHTGSKFLMLENFKNSYGQIESVVSEPIDLSNISQPTVSFYVAHASGTGSNDGLSKFTVKFSNDCGQTWVTKYTTISRAINQGKTSNQSFSPNSKSDWMQINVSGFSPNDRVQNGLLMFEFENKGDNNIYIDDININGTYDDTPVLEFPENNMDSVASSVYIDWKAIPSVDAYEYQVSEDDQFTQIKFSGTKHYISPDPNGEDTRFLASNLTTGKKYYWRVRAHRGSLRTNWSEVWNFTVSNTGQGHEYIDGGALSIPNGIASDKTNFVSFYPNPNKGEIFLGTSTGLLVVDRVAIYSIQGNLVWEGNNLAPGRLNVPSQLFDKGIYLIQAEYNGQNSTHKLFIQ
jgi:PKD repeat protein